MNIKKFIKKRSLILFSLVTFCAINTKIQANGLDITLTEKEQTLLNSFEQKNQAESLIKLLETLEKLSEYPTEAIDELTGKNPNHQVINRVVKRLKHAKEKSKNTTSLFDLDNLQDSSNNSNDSQLIPIFVVASSDNGITAGKVIFQNNSGAIISAFEGQPFIYAEKSYELLSVSQIVGSAGQFTILLKTPTSTEKYIWPR